MCNKMIGMLESLKKLLESLANGTRLTLAQWMRKFVYKHPDYKKDSILTKKIINDLMEELNSISFGRTKDPNFPIIFDLD